jgi:HEAT repeat protein
MVPRSFRGLNVSAAGFGSARAVLVATGAMCVALIALGGRPAPAQDLDQLMFAAPVDDVGFLPPENVAASRMSFQNRPDVLDLEPAVAQAELILAVRLVDVTETKIVHGGRSVQVTQQYRFEPVRVLKGIFAQDKLLMTGQDLGVYRFAEGSDRLERGQLMLVLLGRQGGNYFNCNCNGVPTLAQSIPRLDGKDDPLLGVVELLIGMLRKRDRAERIALLRDGLKKAQGRAAAPLLLAIDRRAFLAAQDSQIADAVLPHLKADSASQREVAARTIGALLEAIPRAHRARAGVGPEQNGLASASASALVSALANPSQDLGARVALIDALSSVGESALLHTPEALAWVDANARATTFAELAARLRVLGQIHRPSGTETAARLYKELLLDGPVEIQTVAGRTLSRLDPRKAAELTLARLVEKRAAGLDVALEITLLGELPRAIAAPALLKAWSRSLSAQERLAFAKACSAAAAPTLVPAASALLDPQQWQTRAYAMEALRRIDTDEAASALWPHLDEEGDVSRKLRLIAFLGKHGFRDGYAQALEHLSQAALREEAVAAIAAIGEPKAIAELRRIWQTSNDLAWNAAAIRALARLGQQDIAPRLLEMARTPGDPLADSALIGLGDLGAPEALPIVREALGSRRDEIVLAAARASARLLARPKLNDDGIRDRLARLLGDSDASPAVRHAALQALAVLNDPRLAATLSAVARDANLEGTPLLAEVEQALSRKAESAAAVR